MQGRPLKSVTDMRGHVSNNFKAERADAEKMLFDYAPLIAQPPAWLDDTAVAEWHRIVPLLKDDIPVSELDASMIASHCQAYADVQHAATLVKNAGMVTGDGKANPAVKQVRDATAQMIRIDEQLGLSVFSRMKMQVKDGGKKSDDPFAQLVNGQ